MRTITLSDLDLPNTPEMLRLFNSKVRNNISTYNNVYDPSKKPEKKFEIFKISLDEDYFYSLMLTDNLPNGENKELYFDFDIAYKIYSNLVLLDENQKAELFERSELYMEENVAKSLEITTLRSKDEKLFNEALKKFGGATC